LVRKENALPALVSHRCRRAAALILAAAIAVQALLTGLAAEGVLVQAPGVQDFAVICHGSGAADQDNGTVPDPARAKHPCCMSCTAAAPALPRPPNVMGPQPGRSFKPPIPEVRTIFIAWRAVRAGLSQAPPSPI
jgi:hypothetical protein